MPKFTKPNRDYDSLPDQLKERPQFVVWDTEPRPNGKVGKIPKNARTGAKADVTDSLDFSDFQTTKAAVDAGTYTGVGFVFTGTDPYVGFDLDNAWDQEQADRLWKTGLKNSLVGLKPWASRFVEQIAPYAYVGLSQSGTGVHVIMNGKVPGKGAKRPVIRNGEQVGEIEIYGQDRYFALTGITLSNGDISVRQQTAINQIRDHFGFRKEGDDDFGAGWGSGAYSGPIWNTGLSDDDALTKLQKAKNRSEFEALFDRADLSKYENDHSRGDIALVGLIAFYTGPDPEQIDRLFRLSALYRDKWDREDYRDGTIGKVLYERGSDRANYWSKDGKSKTQDEQASDSEASSDEKPRYAFLNIDEYRKRPIPEYLIDGLILKGSQAVWYGDTGSYKSFLALDAELSIAAGIDWQGFKTLQGPTAHIIGEGGGLFLKRVDAWLKHHGIESVPDFYMLPASPKLNAEADLKGLVAAIKALPIMPALVVVDTLSRTFKGNENGQEDMQRYRDAAAAIQELGPAVIVIHHSGKNGQIRGNSVLPDDADSIIRFDRNRNGAKLTVEKTKDADIPRPIQLKRNIITLSEAPSDPDVIDAKPETSLVFTLDHSAPAHMDDLTPSQVQILRILLDSGDDGLTHSAWLVAAGLESKTRTFADALKCLKDREFVTQTTPRKKGNTYRVSQSGRDFLTSTGEGNGDES